MHEREVVEVTHLVALQVADEVPAHWHIHLGHLAERFLDLVFANVVHAGLPRRLNGVWTVRLRDRDQRDPLSMPPARHRRSHPITHLRQPRAEVLK